MCAVEFPPTGGGGVIRVAKFARYLPEEGWGVTVLTADIPRPAVRDESLLAELPASVRLIRVPPPFSRASSPLVAATKAAAARRGVGEWLSRTRAAVDRLQVPDRWIGWAMRAIRAVPPKEAYDAILTSGPPHSIHLLGAVLSRRSGRPLVMDIRDEWSLNPLYRSAIPGRTAVDTVLERWCLRQARRIVVVSDVSRERYELSFPSLYGRIRTIPNGYDPADLDGIPPRTTPPAERPVTIGHLGSIHNRRNARPFVCALGALLRTPEWQGKIQLRLIGHIDDDQRAFVNSELPPTSLRIEPHLPHREALSEVAKCDVLLVLTNVEEGGPAVLTGKIYEYLALRRPILAVAPIGPATALIDAAGAGVHADPTDRGAVQVAVERAIELARSEEFRGAPDRLLTELDRRTQARTLSWTLNEALSEVTGDAI